MSAFRWSLVAGVMVNVLGEADSRSRPLRPGGNRTVTCVPGGAGRERVCAGRAGGLAGFLAGCGLGRDDVQGLVAVQTPPGGGGKPGPAACMVHRSVLRSRGGFPYAGGAAALAFCWPVADEMAALSGISLQEAVARVNRHWSQAGADGRVPGIRIACPSLPFPGLRRPVPCTGRRRQRRSTGRSRPVFASVAVMVNAPLASTWKVTSICGSPGPPGGICVKSNTPSPVLRAATGCSP